MLAIITILFSGKKMFLDGASASYASAILTVTFDDIKLQRPSSKRCM